MAEVAGSDRGESALRSQEIPDPAALHPRGPPPPAPDLPPSPTRADRRCSVVVALIAAPAWVALAAFALGLRGDLGAFEVLLRISAWCALVALALAGVLAPRARGLPSGARAVEAWLLAVPILYAVAVVAIPTREEIRPALPGAPYGCIPLSILLSAVPFALAAILLRRSFLSRPGLRGAAVGAACGVAGAIGMHAHCPVETTSHLLLGHGASILAGAVVGAVLGAMRGRA